jgi:putative SOS response-associated peptidase YedK
MTKATAEIANLFRATPSTGANFGSEVYPGYPGLVVAEGQVRSMIWGLPLVLKGKQGQPLKPKPVNNARTDKLGTPFWRDSFEKRRCLIPVSSWAEAEGPKGVMTRTWLSVPGNEVFAVAGIWRPTQEWGEAYAMVMIECCEQTAQVHERMPVLLSPDQWDDWIGGTSVSAIDLCQPWSGDVEIAQTSDSWFRRRN